MPQAEKSIIRSLCDPTISLDTQVFFDTDTGTAKDFAGPPDQVKDQQTSKDIGTNFPMVEINNYLFAQEQILNFEINSTGFMPTLLFRAKVNNKNFSSASMPKDGDLVSIFIRAKNNAFKPIRNDYRITQISSQGGDAEGNGGIYTIDGELSVPGILDEVITGINGTSYTALQSLAKELGLGFASNDTATEDSQLWVSPRSTYMDFIQDIAEHAWKDEKSFFIVFIDCYYHLNFINVNNQFSEDNTLDLQLITNLKTSDTTGGEKATQQVETETGTTPKILTNSQEFYGTAAYIHKFDVANNSSAVSEAFGYNTYRQFFEQGSEKYWSIWVDPLTTEGAAETKIILKGRISKPGTPNETGWKTQNRYVWEGIQYTAPEGNCHEYYTYALGWNERNLVELEKMVMEVQLERGNFNLYRAERIPIFILIVNDLQAQNVIAPVEQEETPNRVYASPILDKFNSGYYMISGMTISYSRASSTNSGYMDQSEQKTPGFTHKVFLTRREWPTPV